MTVEGLLSFRRRHATLQGLPVRVLEEIAAQLPYMEGLPRLVRGLRALGCLFALVSGGFTFIAEQVAARFGFDAVRANVLEITDDQLTGQATGDIVDGSVKARIVQELSARWQIPAAQVITVGDGANELGMMRVAGTGVAFDAKPIVRAQAPQRLSRVGLDAMLYLIGLNDEDLAEADAAET